MRDKIGVKILIVSRRPIDQKDILLPSGTYCKFISGQSWLQTAYSDGAELIFFVYNPELVPKEALCKLYDLYRRADQLSGCMAWHPRLGITADNEIHSIRRFPPQVGCALLPLHGHQHAKLLCDTSVRCGEKMPLRSLEGDNIVLTTWGGIGDWVALITAARPYARIHPEKKVAVARFPHIIRLYKDDLLKTDGSYQRAVDLTPFHLQTPDWDCNYVGSYMQALGCESHSYATPELPKMPKSLLHGRIGIQPYSFTNPNPPKEFIQKIVNLCKEKTGQDVIALGNSMTPHDLKHVNYEYLSDNLSFLFYCMCGLDMILTPLSLCAHVAAGYQIPAFIWLPHEEVRWQVRYESPQLVTNYTDENFFDQLEQFIGEHG